MVGGMNRVDLFFLEIRLEFFLDFSQKFEYISMIDYRRMNYVQEGLC